MHAHQHFHLHRRQGVLDDLKNGFKNLVDELTPGKTTSTTTTAASGPTVQAKQNGQSTKTIFTTMSPTFTDEVAGFSTQLSIPESSPTALLVAPTSNTPVQQAADSTSRPTAVIPTTTGSIDGTLALATDHSTTTRAATSTSGTATNAAASASSSSSTSTSSNDTSTAVKAGIAIGVLAALLIAGVLIYFVYSKRKKQVEKQRIEDDEKLHGPFGGADSRFAGTVERGASIRTARTAATAPRLSLRPVTQFLPNFGERRSSKGAAIALSAAAMNANPQYGRPSGNSAWERPMTSQSNHHENPFGQYAERLDTPNAQRAVSPVSPVDPFNAPENVVGVASTTNSPPGHSHIGQAVGAGVAVAGAGLTRKQSIRNDNSQPGFDLTRSHHLDSIPAAPGSPTGTEFSFTSVSPGQAPGPSNSANAIAAAGGPAATTVHRVQLDFKPTMEDEMGLTAGQLVRLLHEYDDGWALCIRLDRSQQGVVPRTCLSTRPVKPRPAGGPGARNGPPVNPSGRGPRGPPRGPGPNYHPGQQRPMTPQGGPPYPRPESPMRPMTPNGRSQSPGPGRPQSPAMRRPQSPASMHRAQSPGPGGPRYDGRPASPGPRAMSPGPRAASPGPNRQRAGSQSSMNGRRMSPPSHGPSPMNPAGAAQQHRGPPQGPVGRKPVPGSAY